MVQHLITRNLFYSTAVRIIQPNITLYSEMELSEVRLVCDLRGYFPNELTVKWYKNGQEIQNISPKETTFQSLDGEAITYSRTTEIKVDMEDWKTGSSFTCESIKQGTKIAKTTDICQSK